MAVSNDSMIRVLIQIADDHLVLGHRLSEWCGHAPMLEEDLSMPNMALDLIGVARQLYSYASELEGANRTEDDLAYLRTDREYTNCLLVERGNVDFAHTMLRQFYFAAFMQPFWYGLLSSANNTVAAIAAKAEKEIRYHLRHSGEWIIRLGDGTQESAERMVAAVDALHIYTGELFSLDADRLALCEEGVLPSIESIRQQWQNTVAEVFKKAYIEVPVVEYPMLGGREGKHTEEFGYLLADLQYMQRAYPGAQW